MSNSETIFYCINKQVRNILIELGDIFLIVVEWRETKGRQERILGLCNNWNYPYVINLDTRLLIHD